MTSTTPTPQDAPTVVESHGVTFTIRMSQTVVVAQVSASLEGAHLGAVGMVPGGFLGSIVGQPGLDTPEPRADLYQSIQDWAEQVILQHAPADPSGPCGWACPTLHRAPYRA